MCIRDRRARIPCKKYHAGHMRAPPRAHDQPDSFLELLRARTSSSTLSPSSRSPASSTDGHQRRQRVCHHRRCHPRAVVFLNVGAVGAIFIIVADVVDVILSSHISEYRCRAQFHPRFMQMIIGIEDAIIVAAIGCADDIRTVSYTHLTLPTTPYV